MSEAELKTSDLTFETLDYADGRTRRLVETLLSAIAAQTGWRCAATQRLQIDALPDLHGGCLLIFSRLPLHAAQDAVFFGTDASAFIDAARAAPDKSSDSTLFQTADGLYLLVRACTPELQSFLCEFLEPVTCSTLLKARLWEWGRCLAETNALEVLGGTGA